MRHSTLLGIFSALFGLLIVLPAQADDLAYNDPAGQGTQDFPDNLALDFTVNSTITLTSLGVFNADGGTSFDGTETAYVAIFNNSDPTTPVEVVAFTPGATYSTDGSLGYDLFQAITPVVLGPGSYAVDVVGLTTNGNLNTGLIERANAQYWWRSAHVHRSSVRLQHRARRPDHVLWLRCCAFPRVSNLTPEHLRTLWPKHLR